MTLPTDFTADLQGLADQLRLIAVCEWLEQRDYYQSFLTSEQVALFSTCLVGTKTRASI